MGLKPRHSTVLPLSISLPSLRDIDGLTPETISRALHVLRDLFCPLRPYLDLDFTASTSHSSATLLDSGYVSADDDDDDDNLNWNKADLECLDPLERAFAVRWLTGFIGRAEEYLPDTEDVNTGDDKCLERLIDVACSILSHLTCDEDDEDGEEDNVDRAASKQDPGMTRRFDFETSGHGHGDERQTISVELHDIPMQTGRDHTDVGLQTWGASIVLSQRMCSAPEAFDFRKGGIDASTSIVEMGAGIGLVSLVLSSLLPSVTESLPRIIATDYHPTVLENLKVNAASHASHAKEQYLIVAAVQVCHLDWSAPTRDAPLDVPANIIVAADVAYAPEHALWLRDCAAHMLAPDGVFWLMVSIRPNGKFEGISDIVEAAFERASSPGEDGRVLRIMQTEMIDKSSRIGRADEVGYKLYKIMWA